MLELEEGVLVIGDLLIHVPHIPTMLLQHPLLDCRFALAPLLHQLDGIQQLLMLHLLTHLLLHQPGDPSLDGLDHGSQCTGVVPAVAHYYKIMENQSRLDVEIRQVKSLLGQFRKTKMKCLELCERLNRDLPNLLQYEVMEVTCTRRIDSFDLLGVLKLKKELLANLGEISQAEREMTYEMQKNSFKKAIKINPPKMSREPSVIQEELGPFEIPSYESKAEPNENKVDRLAAFILSLGRSMTTLRKCIIGEWEWDEQNFYKYEPEYIQLLRRIEMFKMRDEELVELIQRRFEKERNEILKKGERIKGKEEDEFEVIKIPIKAVERAIQGQPRSKREPSLEKPYHPVSMIEPKRKHLAKKMPLEKINEEKAGDSQRLELPKFASDNSLDAPSSFKHLNNTHSRIGNRLMEQQAQQNNYVYMVKRISPDSQLNSSIASSISSLRSMRKKVFDDDIWDQFQKI